MLGTYESTRDSRETADCWRVRNDQCSPHFHSSVEVVYVTAGELQASLNGRSYTVRRTQVLISPSYAVHFYHTERAADSIVLVAPLDFIPSFKKVFMHQTFRENLYQDAGEGSELRRCMEALCLRVRDGAGQNLIKGYVYVVLGLLAESVGLVDLPPERGRYLAKDILCYLEENYLFPVTLEGVAQHFGYSKSRFSHLFSACFGQGLNEYVNMLRCRHAALQLGEASASLIEAALGSGFECMRTFYRAFKRCYGVTPTQYLNAAGARPSGPERRVEGEGEGEGE